MPAPARFIGFAAAAALAGTPALAGDKEFAPHVVAGAFIGATTTEDTTAATYGIEAAYRATQRLSVGGAVELIPSLVGDEDATVIVGLAHLHADNGARVFGGAGREYVKGKEKPIWRAGAAYDFHLGSVHISPTASVDFLEGTENFVYGVAVARAF